VSRGDLPNPSSIQPIDFPRLRADFRPSTDMPKVTILPQNLSAEVDAGETLLEAGEKAGVEMEAGCFNCACGTCAAEIVSGMENLAPPSPEELDVLDQWNKDPEKFRLTCCVRITGPSVTMRQAH